MLVTELVARDRVERLERLGYVLVAKLVAMEELRSGIITTVGEPSAVSTTVIAIFCIRMLLVLFELIASLDLESRTNYMEARSALHGSLCGNKHQQTGLRPSWFVLSPRGRDGQPQCLM